MESVKVIKTDKIRARQRQGEKKISKRQSLCPKPLISLAMVRLREQLT